MSSQVLCKMLVPHGRSSTLVTGRRRVRFEDFSATAFFFESMPIHGAYPVGCAVASPIAAMLLQTSTRMMMKVKGAPGPA
jgi:hypothetical protein